MTSTGLLATEPELEAIEHLGASRPRTVRAAVLLAGRLSVAELVDAVGELPALAGAGRHLTIGLPEAELAALDRLAALAGTSRSRIMRAGVRLLVGTTEKTRRELLAALPRDGRLLQRASLTHDSG